MDRLNRESHPAYAAFLNEAGRAYNEPAFRHFLAIERRRAEYSNRSVLLLFVSLRFDNARPHMPEPTATAILGGLAEAVREVDFVGWFREGRVAGAVLAEGSVAATDHAHQLMADRVRRILGNRLPARQSSRLRVRIVQLSTPAHRLQAPASSGY